MQTATRTPASFPSHAQQPRVQRRPHSKARSISSLPNSARGSPILPSSVNSGPGRLYTATPARQRSPTIHSQPGLPSTRDGPAATAHRHSSPRPSPRTRASVSGLSRQTSTRSHAISTTPAGDTSILSPSKLPATERMSYFPPFESMGSGDAESSSAVAGPSRPASRTDGGPIGPASRDRSHGSTPESKRSAGSQRHGKVRSLGSLGGFMSWATFTPSPANTPSEVSAPDSDSKVVDALTRRTSQAKRRTLESTQHESFSDWERNVRRNHVRRQTLGEGDEYKAASQGSQTQRQRPHLSLPALPSWRNPMPSPPVVTLSPDIPTELFHVEISNPASSNSSPYKNATLPPSHLSFLRRLTTGDSYPVSLADIDRVDADAGDDDDDSPTAHRGNSFNYHSRSDDEVEVIDAGLSPTSAYASLSSYGESESRPVTPAADIYEELEDGVPRTSDSGASEEMDRVDRLAHIAHTNYYTTSLPLSRRNTIEAKEAADVDVDVDPYFLDATRYSHHLQLKRSDSRSSGRSCDSKATIRPSASVLGGKERVVSAQTIKAAGGTTHVPGNRPVFEVGFD